MNEKKLNDEDILKALEMDCLCVAYGCCESCPLFDKDCKTLPKAIKDLIHRLQEENRKLNNEWDNTTKYCSELQKQVDELKEEKDKYQKKWHTAYMNELDLQKQVDELTSKNEWFANENDYLKKCADAFLGDYKNAVKDTAKEILQSTIQLSDMCESFYEFQNRLIDLIEINYGIEVETKTIIPEKIL